MGSTSSKRTDRSRATDLGAGLWQSSAGQWELVRVMHREDDDMFFFSMVHSQDTAGARVGGYGRDELATLYMGDRLTLCPRRLEAAGFTEEPAVILNQFGDPVLAEWDWEDGLDPLIADSAFHAPAEVRMDPVTAARMVESIRPSD